MANVWDETPEEQAARQEGAEAPQEEAAEPVDLGSMTKQELEDYALENDISLGNNMTKAEMVKAIEDAG